MTINDFINNDNLVLREDTELIPLKPAKYKEYFQEHPELFSLEEDICLVHTTDYFPFNKRIRPSYEKNVTKQKFCDVTYKLAYFYDHRRTVHFCLNGLVKSHNEGGNHDGRKYFILEPIKYHFDEIVSYNAEDTWTTSGVDLSNDSIILIDKTKELSKEELEEINKKNYKIIYFEGEPHYIIPKVLRSLGYLPKSIDKFGFAQVTNENDMALISEKRQVFLSNEKTMGIHRDSIYYTMELAFIRREKLIYAILNKLIDTRKGCSFNDDEILKLYEAYIKNPIYGNFLNYFLIDYDSINNQFFCYPDEVYYEKKDRSESIKNGMNRIEQLLLGRKLKEEEERKKLEEIEKKKADNELVENINKTYSNTKLKDIEINELYYFESLVFRTDKIYLEKINDNYVLFAHIIDADKEVMEANGFRELDDYFYMPVDENLTLIEFVRMYKTIIEKTMKELNGAIELESKEQGSKKI